jgi:hypothetical protein
VHRREIEHALATTRMIVPVQRPSFDYTDAERFLPDDLGRELRRFNGQELPQRWFKYAVQQRAEEFPVPTRVGSAAVQAADQPVVDRILEKAEAAPTISGSIETSSCNGPIAMRATRSQRCG